MKSDSIVTLLPLRVADSGCQWPHVVSTHPQPDASQRCARHVPHINLASAQCHFARHMRNHPRPKSLSSYKGNIEQKVTVSILGTPQAICCICQQHQLPACESSGMRTCRQSCLCQQGSSHASSAQPGQPCHAPPAASASQERQCTLQPPNRWPYSLQTSDSTRTWAHRSDLAARILNQHTPQAGLPQPLPSCTHFVGTDCSHRVILPLLAVCAGPANSQQSRHVGLRLDTVAKCDHSPLPTAVLLTALQAQLRPTCALLIQH